MSKRLLAGISLLALCLVLAASVEAREVKDYSATIENFKKIPVVAEFFDGAHGYAVFPSIGKGGLGIGGSHGKGQVYRGQAYAQIIFFENEQALTQFIGGNFEFSASASAIAVQATAEARASTETTGASAGASKTSEKATANAQYQDGVVVFTMAKGGLMYAATIAGQKYSYKPVE